MAKDPSEEYWKRQNDMWRRGRSSGELGYMTASGYVLKGSEEDLKRKQNERQQMAYEMNDMSGSLFKNDKKVEGSNQPDYRGEIKINGVSYWQSAWLKTSASGVKFMSFAYQPKEAAPAPAPAPVEPPKPADDVPF
jgi:hypothetical protein